MVVETAAIVVGQKDGRGIPLGTALDRPNDLTDPVVAGLHREGGVLGTVPRRNQERHVGQIAGDLLKRVFDGSARSLVLGALSAQPTTGKELADIRRMLEAFAKEKGRSQ